MLPLDNMPIVVAGSAAVAIALLTIFIQGRQTTPDAKLRKERYPPGPRRYPILGNLLNFPARRWYEAFSAWQKDYGTYLIAASRILALACQ